MHRSYPNDDGDRSDVLDSTLATVLRILDGMNLADTAEDAVIAAPSFYDGPVLLKDRSRFNHFAVQLAVNLRFVGYSFEDVAFLTVRRLCEMYVRDSFPLVPSVPLSNEQYELHFPSSVENDCNRKDFSICFILGAPRSGTTLLRAMLNIHTGLWAPGELHLANFETMADRARDVGSILRYMPLPEGAARFGESVADSSRRFRGWELAAVPVTEVYQQLHDADPAVMIVDKSPPYSTRLELLERIGEQFPNATFIHLVRNPHEVIRSYVRMQFHRGDRRLFDSGLNPYQAGEAIWYACNANAEAFMRSLPADRKRVVRFEDLTSEPADSLRTICQALQQEFQPRMSDPYATPGVVAAGAGDLHINLLERVEPRPPRPPFYPLGERCQEVASRFGYQAVLSEHEPAV